METLHDIKHFIKGIGIDIILAMAGFFGALVSISREKQMSTIQRVISVLSGVGCANYLTPLLCSFINVSDNTKSSIAFLIGYLGLKSIEMAIDKLNRRLKKDE